VYIEKKSPPLPSLKDPERERGEKPGNDNGQPPDPTRHDPIQPIGGFPSLTRSPKHCIAPPATTTFPRARTACRGPLCAAYTGPGKRQPTGRTGHDAPCRSRAFAGEGEDARKPRQDDTSREMQLPHVPSSRPAIQLRSSSSSSSSRDPSHPPIPSLDQRWPRPLHTEGAQHMFHLTFRGAASAQQQLLCASSSRGTRQPVQPIPDRV
jgi:hypothetical protein